MPNILPAGNNPPTAQNDVNTTELNTDVTSTLLSNDSDTDGDNIVITNASIKDGAGTDIPFTLGGTATTVSGKDKNGVAITNAGTVKVNADGTYEFKPATGFTGTIDDITYTISDGNGGTDTAILSLNVIDNFGNSTFANDDANAAKQGVNIEGNIKTNDFDLEGNTQTLSSPSASFGGTNTPITLGTATAISGVGTLTLSADGKYTFVPEPNFVGTVPVTYSTCDNGTPQACDKATLYLTSIPLDVIPDIAAENDINQIPQDTVINGALLTNDEGVASVTATGFTLGTAKTVAGVDENGNNVANAGSLTINGNGTYTFTPTAGFTGTINPVTYTGKGAGVDTNDALLSIEVIPNIQPAGNNPPTAQNDVNTTEINTTVTSTILNNDSDPDGDNIVITSASIKDGAGTDIPFTFGTAKTVTGKDENGVAIANAGTVKVNADGSYEFIPATGFTGSVDDITYTVSDGNGGTDTATLNLNVIPNFGNNTFANDDANSATQGTSMEGNVVLNDFDPELNMQTISSASVNGTPITVGTVAVPVVNTIAGVGTVTINTDGSYNFAPDANFTGTVPVIYSTCDTGTPQTCDEATLYLTSIPAGFTAKNDINQTPQDTAVNSSLTTNDQGGNITVTSVLINGNSTAFAVPAGNTGVTINNVPGINKEGFAVTNAGSIIIKEDGTYTFTPSPGFTGTIDPITYTGKGDGIATDTATISIEVLPNELPSSNPPTAQNDVHTTEVNTTVNSTVLSNDTDLEGDNLTITSATGVTINTPTTVTGKDKTGATVANAGTVQLNTNGTYEFIPAAGFTGTVDDITYTISDGNGGTDTAILNLNVIDNFGNSTFANDDAHTAPQGTTMTGNILTNDFDPEGNPHTVTSFSIKIANTTSTNATDGSATIGNVGTVTLVSDGTYTFVPVASFIGTVPVTYIKCDNQSPQACAEATLYLTSVPKAIKTDVMITQVYQFGADSDTDKERWIEITNIGTTDVPANTIHVQLYKDKTGDQTNNNPDVSYTVTTLLEAGKSVLFKNVLNNTLIANSELATDATVVLNAALTDLDDAVNDIITLSTSTTSSWANRYDVVSNINNKTSVVRIDERLTPNKNYDANEWVVFIDDAITPYQPIEETTVAGIKRHPQDALISEIKNSSKEANTLLGLHRIDITTSNSSSNTWTNGFPDRSRSVVIDQDFEHTGSRLSARKLKIDASTKLTVTDQLLVVTNEITLDGNIRLAGTSAQLVQTHATTTKISGNGKLLVDQNSTIPSLYRYGYMSSPVTSIGINYTLEDVLKDGTTPLNATDIVGTTIAKNINFIDGYDGDTTDPISLAKYWIYTYAPASNGRANWAHKNEDGEIARGEGFIFKGPGAPQNYTFMGTPNDGNFSPSIIAAGNDYLVGNPYPSAINARKFIEDNLNETTGTLYFWEHKESKLGEGSGIDGHVFGGYIGGYATLNLSGGVAADVTANTANNNNGTSGLDSDTPYTTPRPYIAIGQGFFIEGDVGGAIVFNNSQREYVTEGAKSVFFRGTQKTSKTQSNLLPVIKLGFEYKNEQDLMIHHQIAVSFQETNSFAFDKGYDSKVYETGKTDIYFKFPSDDKDYVIAGVQEISDDLEVPLEIKMNYTGQVNIMVDELQNVSKNIYVTDKLTGTSYNVKEQKNTLTLEKGTYTDRFVLTFKESSALSLEDEILAAYTNIYADNENNQIVISKNSEVAIKKVELFNVLGKKVSLWNIKEQKETYQLDIKKQIPTGVYIVKMNTNKGTINKKVVIE